MKFNLGLFLVSSLVGFGLGADKCSTQYATTKVSKVSTYTKTVTTTSVSTYTYGTSYVPSSSTISYTFVSVKGKTTTTVPTSASFTPIISAPKGPPTEAVGERAPTTKYPKQVFCTSTVTSTSYQQIGTATATYTAYVTKSTFTSTKTAATATAYAACEPTNFVSTFHGATVDYYYSFDDYDVCDVNQYGFGGEEACANGAACCSFAQANDYQGFIWSNTTGRHCVVTNIIWGFETGHTDTTYYIGNGPTGSGYYGPPS